MFHFIEHVEIIKNFYQIPNFTNMFVLMYWALLFSAA